MGWSRLLSCNTPRAKKMMSFHAFREGGLPPPHFPHAGDCHTPRVRGTAALPALPASGGGCRLLSFSLERLAFSRGRLPMPTFRVRHSDISNFQIYLATSPTTLLNCLKCPEGEGWKLGMAPMGMSELGMTKCQSNTCNREMPKREMSKCKMPNTEM